MCHSGVSSRASTDRAPIHKFAPDRIGLHAVEHAGAMRTPYGYELPRLLTVPRAVSLGISRSRIRTELQRGSWRRIATGVVLTVPDAPTRLDWCEAGLALAGPDAGLSGWDAVGLHGIRVEQPAGAPVLVLVRACRSRRVGPILIRRSDRPYLAALTPAEHPVFPLAPLVAPARAVADACLLGADLGPVRATVARAIQIGRCTPDTLAAELARCPRNGSSALRQALAEVAAGARSTAEAATAAQLRRSRLPDFELNVPVLGPNGRIAYVIDVLWRELRAALEIDSREYHFRAADWQATMRRHNLLTGAGLSVVHYAPSQLTADGGWLRDVEEWLRRRAAELGVPYVPGSSHRRLGPATPAPLRLVA